MAQKNSSYWKERFIQLENASNTYAQDTYRQIEPVFNKAERELQNKIERWYARIARNNQVSMTEAKQMLTAKELEEFHWDVQDYIKYGRDNAFTNDWIKELENASAKFHINRLEALKLQIQQAAEVAFKNELDEVDQMARKVYSEDFYHTLYEVQKGFNIGWDVSSINQNKLKKVLSKPWAADGKNFSSRVWESKSTMVNDLYKELTRTCIMGKAPDEGINHMSKFVNKKLKNVKMQAGRLVMTEQAFFSSAAQKEAFNDLDVEKYEIVATLDSHTSSICQDMDGKVFDMEDYQPGVTAPPFHVWCRSCTVPYFEDDFSPGKRAARDKDGKTYYVPDSMKYKEWFNKHVKPDKEALTKIKMEKNLNSDKVQYNKYKNILNKNAPDSFAKFQNLKYNNEEEYSKIRLLYKDEKLKDKIKIDYNTNINLGKQGKHLKYHNNFKKGRSYLTISESEIQKIVDKYAGTGDLVRDKNGKWRNQEVIKTDSIIGVDVDNLTGEEFKVTDFKIHYSKDGVHIVPKRRVK